MTSNGLRIAAKLTIVLLLACSTSGCFLFIRDCSYPEATEDVAATALQTVPTGFDSVDTNSGEAWLEPLE